MFHRRKQSRGLSFEGLESRKVFAGNVTASVNTAGDLVITGDGAANGVLVRPLLLNGSPLAGRFVVTGVNGGGAATTINGSTSSRFFRGVTRDISFDGNAGDDNFTIGNVNVTSTVGRDLHLEGGTGNDRVTVERMFVRDDLQFRGEAGEDGVTILNTTVGGVGVDGNQNDIDIEGGTEKDFALVQNSFVFRDLYIDMGLGTTVESMTVNTVGIGRDLRIRTDDGRDSLSLSHLDVARNVNIDTEQNNDNLFLFDITAVDMTIETDGGIDRVTILSSQILDDLFLTTGNEDDIVSFDGVSVGDDMNVNLGGGNDSLTVRNSSADDAFLNGSTQTSNNPGDRIKLENNAFDDQDVDGFEGTLP